jgi:hypothetical protein
MKKILVSSVAILICAGIGTALAWLILLPLGLTGVVAALVTVFLAMILSSAAFAALIALGRALKILK